ncbi:hypothetical protein [Streptomyces sp. URMC 129]|uniref:hypothetical protein n=1 Tax=Streptomyces sp. URMC 129 TaxID=3423407 RepID=UPI003F19B8FD
MIPDPVPTAPGPFDRKLARQWLKEQLALEPAILKQIARTVRDAKRDVVDAAYAKRDRSVQDRLATTPVVDMLRKSHKVHPGPLIAAGVFTAAHVLELGESSLRVKAGIDANAASRWVDAARQVRRARPEDARPADRVGAWQDEDVTLVRSLLVLDSAEGLQLAPPTAAIRLLFDEARVLLRRTGTLRWTLQSAHHADLAQLIADVGRRIAAGQISDNLPQVENHASRHLDLVRRLDDPRAVAERWHSRREELLELLKEAFPH